ncbi:MAG: ubiquitin conjugating enzyme E2 [Amphiamblys sp. WSBS2006]|nr:MAG: ubiquitin conjugating enzyme E2 [Amphiamblys sp. WSBS2006]
MSTATQRETEPFFRRINKEIKNIRKEQASLVSVTMFGEDKKTSSISIVQAEENKMSRWKATIQGPEGTPFEGGSFELDVTLPEDYPYSPLKIKFLSEMFHPNIYEDGSICLDVLGEEWNPLLTVFTILLYIQALLSNPNMEDPAANAEADKLFHTDKEEYARRVRAAFGRTNQDSAADSEPSASPEMTYTVKGNVDGTHEEQAEEVLD